MSSACVTPWPGHRLVLVERKEARIGRWVKALFRCTRCPEEWRMESTSEPPIYCTDDPRWGGR